ncbi:MAG: ABC transporter ATP-binding protein [Clostridia bacterium]|nr:ABC transporter ATP-binding protein [Clostridia bacterium]
MPILSLENVSKIYSLKGGCKKPALSNVSFSAKKGEMIGIIGRNGSGKSTLLKVISSITAPTDGKIHTNGKIYALLELGAGFNPEYSGIENIYLNGAISGLSRNQIKNKINEILDFAEIGDFANQPVKTYSDGMFVRLAFSVAICFEPEILVIDEALSVGDFLFQAKCFRKINELKNKGVTILYVSHDVDSVRRLCDRIIWLKEGRICMDGEPLCVTAAYIADSLGQGDTRICGRFGSHIGSIVSVSAPEIWEHQSDILIKAKILKPAHLSISIKNKEGLDIMVLSTKDLNCSPKSGEISFKFKNPLCSGQYSLSAGLEIPDTNPIEYYDYIESSLVFESVADKSYYGTVHVPAEVDIIE